MQQAADLAFIQAAGARLAARRLPIMVIIDVTNTCNLACIHCPQPTLQASAGFKARHFDFAAFGRIVDEIARVGEPILLRFAGDGEPTVHPRLFEMMTLAKRGCGAAVSLTTNGVLFTDRRIEEVLEIGIDMIDVSIDALTRATYERVRRGGDYARLMANIFRMIDRRRALKASTKLMVSFVRQKENEHETEGFRAFWEPLVERVLVRSLHSAVGLVKHAESAAANAAASMERYPCTHLYKRLTVDFDGRIKFCAHEWLGAKDVILADIAESSLEQAFHGAAMKRVRGMHETGTYAPGFICTGCTDWAASRWEFGYERLIDSFVFGKPALMPELPLLV